MGGIGGLLVSRGVELNPPHESQILDLHNEELLFVAKLFICENARAKSR